MAHCKVTHWLRPYWDKGKLVRVGILVCLIFPFLTGCGGGGNSPTYVNPDPSIPAVRTYPFAVYDGNENMIIFGGGNTYTGFNDVWSYNISTHTWTQLRSPSPSPTPRRAGCAFLDGKGGIIIFGGYAGTDYPDFVGQRFNDMWRYDIANQSWQQINTTNGPSNRGYFSAISDDNDNIIIFGGWGDSGMLSDVWRFNISSQTWTKLASSPGPPGLDSASAFYDGNGNMIIFGGWDSNELVSDMWKYNISSQKWTKLSTTLPTARECNITVNDGNGNVIIFGGTTYGLRNDMWNYNISSQVWTEIKNSGTLPPARWGHCGVYDSNGKIVIFGGQTSNIYQDIKCFLNDLWEYNLTSHTWTKIEPTHQ